MPCGLCAIDLQKTDWKFRTGFHEQTGVSLKGLQTPKAIGGYTHAYQVTPPSKTCTTVCRMPISMMMYGWCDVRPC
jgi:hypothetical protein